MDTVADPPAAVDAQTLGKKLRYFKVAAFLETPADKVNKTK